MTDRLCTVSCCRVPTSRMAVPHIVKGGDVAPGRLSLDLLNKTTREIEVPVKSDLDYSVVTS